MTDFKEGDKVKVKHLSEKDFKEIYIEKYNHIWSCNYESYYLRDYCKYFNKTYTVSFIDYYIYLLEDGRAGFYPEELEKTCSLKNRLALVKELIK
jgi:hypothetical protein